jgi:DNA-binding phage protein
LSVEALSLQVFESSQGAVENILKASRQAAYPDAAFQDGDPALIATAIDDIAPHRA